MRSTLSIWKITTKSMDTTLQPLMREAYTKDAIMKEILLLKVQDFLVENANITEVTEDEYYGDDEEYLDDEDVDMEDLGDDVEGALEDGDEDADEADTDDASETETETPEISETDSNAE